MEGTRFEKRRIPQVGPNRVEQAMPNLMRHHIGTLAGKERRVADLPVEESKTLAIVVGVEVDAVVLQQLQPPTIALPALEDTGEALPGLEGREAGLAALPEQELGGARLEGALRRRIGEREPCPAARPIGSFGLNAHRRGRRSCPRVVGNEVDRHR